MTQAAKIYASATRSGLDILKAGLMQAAVLALRGAQAAAVSSAKSTRLWNNKTGDTRGSIRSQLLGLQGFVEARGAATFLEWGTRPHVIAARNTSTLRFVVGGQVFFRRMVHHPGTRERPFMREARQQAESAAEYGVEIYVNAAIHGARA